MINFLINNNTTNKQTEIKTPDVLFSDVNVENWTWSNTSQSGGLSTLEPLPSASSLLSITSSLSTLTSSTSATYLNRARTPSPIILKAVSSKLSPDSQTRRSLYTN